MPWRGPAYVGEFPTLGYVVAEWIQAYCVVPDRDMRGTPFLLTDEQLRFLIFFYALTPDGGWRYPRGAQLARPQKWGKGPLAAGIVCAEAEGPVLFDGWDAAGEPVGHPWATPHIQITACSEDQTENTWRAIQPMIELGPLGESFIPDTGLTRINLRGGGIIEPVTASARSRLGQRISCAVQDQTESWVRTNNGWWLADNQRRNLAGMGGRFLETCNAPDPAEQSVASRTPSEPGVYIDDPDGGPGSVRNKAERRKVLNIVYGDSTIAKGGWVNLDRVDAEIEALLEHDPAQAERFFLHRKLASEGAAFDIESFKGLAKPQTIPAQEVIALGVDGARHSDAIAVIATHVRSGYQWVVDVIERPPNAPEDYEHDFGRVDGAVSDIFERYLVWRCYCDDQYIGTLVENWQNRFGDKRVVIWHTNRPRPIAWAVRNYEDAVSSGDVHHDGDPHFISHIRNARKRKLTVLDDNERQMHTLCKDSIGSPRKIDAAMAAVLSWEARSDCIAAGAIYLGKEPEPEKQPEQDAYRADHAPAAAFIGDRRDRQQRRPNARLRGAMPVPEGTIAEVRDWVGDDPGRAQEALDAERAGQNRSTLISQLEAVCPTAPSQEDAVSESSTTEPETQEGVDEETGLAPGPEQPVGEVEIYAEDAGTHVGPLHVRDTDVELDDDAGIQVDPASDLHPESDKTRAQAREFDKDAEPEAIEGEQVETVQGVSGTTALALSINGTNYMFDKQLVGALKQVVDQAVVGLAL